jgi:hypothetical protein
MILEDIGMKKTYALLFLFLFGLGITWLIGSFVVGTFSTSTTNAASSVSAPPAPVSISLDEIEEICDNAPIFYASHPAKCLTDEGLKPVKQYPITMEIEDQK